MTTWTLSPQYKKSAIERQFWRKDDKLIIREEGYRWATFTVESDERPLTDEELRNEDGYELGSIANDESWELVDMTDGCWADSETGNLNTTQEDLAEFDEAWEEDLFDGVESKGWSNDDTEYHYSGPLQLTNEDSGEVFYGEPPESPEVTEEQLAKELDDLVVEFNDLLESNPEGVLEFFDNLEQPEVTEWFPVAINPVRNGTYEVVDEPTWPMTTYAEWNGKEWNNPTVSEWRGLAQEPVDLVK